MRGWGTEKMKSTGFALNSNKRREMKWLDLEGKHMGKRANRRKSRNLTSKNGLTKPFILTRQVDSEKPSLFIKK